MGKSLYITFLNRTATGNQGSISRMKTEICIAGVIFALLVVRCVSDAPHINPLDPALNHNQLTEVSGKVTRLNAAINIAGATLRLMPGPVFTQSQPDGTYRFAVPLAGGTYWLHCEAPGFSADSVQLNLAPGQTVIQNFALNGLPEFTGISLATRHEANFITIEDFFLDIQVSVADADGPGEIKSVWCEIPTLGYVDTLRFLPQQQRFFARLLPQKVVQSRLLTPLEGQPFVIFVADQHGAVAVSPPQFIKRIIDGIPRTVGPNGAASIPFDFRWEAFPAPFRFHYRIEIFPNINIQLPPVATLDEIPADSTTRRFATQLDAGNYFWVLYVVDEFGNYSRSIQTTLNIN